MSSRRKLQRRQESPAEIILRMDAEARCRRIAEVIKGLLPKSESFVLVTATLGDDDSFANLSYVSGFDRDDAARMLTEMLDHWRTEGKAVVTEPSVQTCTFLREAVHHLAEVHATSILGTMPESVAQLRKAVDADDGNEAYTIAGRLAVEALAIFDRYARAAARRRDPEEN